MSIVNILTNSFKGKEFKLKEAYEVCPNVNKESVRVRIYESTGNVFERISRGLYVTKDNDCIVIEGNGSVGQACINKNRKSIIIEKSHELIEKIINRLDCIKLNINELQLS